MDRQTQALFESLEPRTLLSATLAESFATAQGLAVEPVGDSAIQSTLSDPAAGDFYQFTAPALGWTTIEMKAMNDGMDPALLAYDSTSRPLAYNNNASRTTRDSRMRLVVRPGQTVYLKAWDLADVGGQYSLNVANRAFDDVGNTIATAREARLNPWCGMGVVASQINYAGDVDVIKLTAVRDGTMIVEVTAWGRGSSLLPAMTVTDAAGTVLPSVEGTDASGKLSLSFGAVAGQTYYLHASSINGTTGWWLGRFRNTVDPFDPPTPTPEPEPEPEPTPTPEPEPVVEPPLVIEPGSSIAAHTRTTAAGLQLVVLGTTGSDVITLSQTTTGVTLLTLAGSQNFEGNFASLAVYGFAGGDTLRTDRTVSLSVELYGGEGNDSLFASGAGLARLFGEAGDDLLVSVGGGSDQLAGGEGNDGFWMDSQDAASDASAAETAVGAVHRISAFAQPWTTDPADRDYVALEADGQNLRDPELDPNASRYADFSGRSLFVNGAQYNDIIQGNLGDCYYLASLAGLAQQDPALVQQMIAPLGDGTYAVRFYRNGREVYYRIDGDLPVTSRGRLAYAQLTGQGETWVALMEKAYAHFRYNENSYDSIIGGWMATVLRELTNTSTSTHWTTSDSRRTYSYIQTQLSAGHAVTAGTISDPSGPVVGNHAYMVDSAFTADGVQYIRVYNPWGVDGRGSDSNTRDGLVTMTAQVFVTNFDGVVSSQA